MYLISKKLILLFIHKKVTCEENRSMDFYLAAIFNDLYPIYGLNVHYDFYSASANFYFDN